MPIKHDTGKPLPDLVLGEFATALMEVINVGTFGANKYEPRDWCELPEGEARYREAAGRHFLKRKAGQLFDDESGEYHLAHECWNKLAELYFHLKENEDVGFQLTIKCQETGLYYAPEGECQDQPFWWGVEEGRQKIWQLAKVGKPAVEVDKVWKGLNFISTTGDDLALFDAKDVDTAKFEARLHAMGEKAPGAAIVGPAMAKTQAAVRAMEKIVQKDNARQLTESVESAAADKIKYIAPFRRAAKEIPNEAEPVVTDVVQQHYMVLADSGDYYSEAFGWVDTEDMAGWFALDEAEGIAAAAREEGMVVSLMPVESAEVMIMQHRTGEYVEGISSNAVIWSSDVTQALKFSPAEARKVLSTLLDRGYQYAVIV